MIVSAHDGYPRLLRSGADFIEIDIRRNAEGVIILAHDEPEAGRVYPALDAVLDEIDDKTGLHLDLKEKGFEVELLTRVLQRLPAQKVVATPDFDESVRAIKAQFPEVRMSPIDFRAIDYRSTFDGEIPLWVWTVDDAKLMKRFLKDRRIEGIITNRPDLALKLRKARW